MTQSTIEVAEIGLPPIDVPEEGAPRSPPPSSRRGSRTSSPRSTSTRSSSTATASTPASLVFLCNLDPRFEEVLLVLAGGRRTLIVGKEDVGYVPIVPIDVDVVCCATLSLMGIDRSAVPDPGRGAARCRRRRGERIGVVGWKALVPDESSGTFSPIFAPAFFVDTLREIAGDAELVVDVTAALSDAGERPADTLLGRPDRALRVGSVALLGVGDGHRLERATRP